MMYITSRQIKELEFAKSLGVIESTDENYLMEKMRKYNDGACEVSFGKTNYNEHSFVGYLLAKFRMDFVFEKLNYKYKTITAEDIRNYYDENKIIFLRENNEYFRFEEMEQVIVKHLREEEYEEAIDGLLY